MDWWAHVATSTLQGQGLNILWSMLPYASLSLSLSPLLVKLVHNQQWSGVWVWRGYLPSGWPHGCAVQKKQSWRVVHYQSTLSGTSLPPCCVVGCVMCVMSPWLKYQSLFILNTDTNLPKVCYLWFYGPQDMPVWPSPWWYYLAVWCMCMTWLQLCA